MLENTEFMGTAEEFLHHMSVYQVQPFVRFITFASYIAAFVAIYLVLARKEPPGKVTRNDRIITGIFAAFWLFEGLFHQILLKPGSFEGSASTLGLAIPFIIQGIFILIWGVIKPSISYAYEKGSPYSQLGVFFVICGLFLYPIIAYFSGYPYPQSPVIPLICPMEVMYLGVMLWATRIPKFHMLIPCYWGIVGGALAVVFWSWWPDILLIASGAIVPILIVLRPKKGRFSFSPLGQES